MELKSRTIGNITIIYLRGRLDIFEAESAEASMSECVEKNRGNHVVLVLEGLDYLSSSGLRIFISLKRRLSDSGCELVLCNKSNNAVNIFFKIINIKDMFLIVESEDEAIKYLAVPGKPVASRIAS